MTVFILSSHQGGFTINECHNTPNAIHVKDGELSATAMKAIAYKILTMVETDRVI
jgi:hypothetical protein